MTLASTYDIALQGLGSTSAQAGGVTGVPLVATVAGETTAGAANSATLQAAVSAGGYVSITKAGVYCLSAPINVPDNTTVYIGRDVVLVKVDDATNASTMFRNVNYQAGSNVNIAIVGEGTIYCNANSYASVYAANTADCPVLPAVMGLIPALSTTSSNLYTMNGIHLESVKNARVGGGLRIMMASKYQIYGASLTDFKFRDIEFYSDDTLNPANGSTYGRDGIHVQGLTDGGLISEIRGTVNDDFVVLNCRDIDAFTSVRSVGYIRNVTIEKIRGKNQRRAGCAVILYGACDTGTLSAGKDTCPAITSMTQSGTLVTVNFAAAHKMFVGGEFSITGSSNANYNVTNCEVAEVPSATSIAFYLTSGAGAYTTGAVMQRFYSLAGITVRDVDQVTYSGAGVQFSCTTDTALNYSVCHSPVVENVRALATNPNGVGVVCQANTRLVNPTIRNPIGRNDQSFPIVNLTYTPNNVTEGALLVENPIAEVPYKPDSGSGAGWINLPTSYEQITLRGGSVQMVDGGGGWVNAVAFGGSAGGKVLIDGIRVTSPSGAQSQVARCDKAAMGTVEIRGCQLDNLSEALHVGGAVTSGNFVLAANTSPSRSNSPMMTYYGTGCVGAMYGNLTGGLGSSGVLYAGSSGTLTLIARGNNFSSTYLIAPGSTFAAAGLQLRTEFDAVVDATQAYIGTNPGNTFWNNNAGFGAGVGYYGRTNAGAWTRLF